MILFISFSNGTFLLQLYTNYIYLFCKLKMHFFIFFFARLSNSVQSVANSCVGGAAVRVAQTKWDKHYGVCSPMMVYFML